jgi:hypothetical protein
MKTWMWILAIVALILLLWRVRESFEATPSIKAPPYDAAEKERIYNMVRNRSATPPYTVLGFQDMLMARAKTMNPNEQNERKLQEFAGGLVSPAIESFFTTVYKPATTPITEANIDAFMLTRTSELKDVEKHILMTYFIGQSGVGRTGVDSYTERLAAEGLAQNFDFSRRSTTAQGSGTSGSAMSGSGMSGSGTSGSDPSPTCPAGSTIDDSKLRCMVFVDKECPPGTVLDSSIGKCSAGGIIKADLSCPPGSSAGSDGKCVLSEPGGNPTCPAGYTYDTKQVSGQAPGEMPRRVGICVPSSVVGARVTVSQPGDVGTVAGDTSRTSGTTTGGTTGTTQGPNSGGGGLRRKQVFGPIFTGVGDGGVVPSDSSTTNRYPELLGGDGGRASTRIDGVGIVTPSGGGITLPPSSSLGSDENSKYFPFSRQPGDMDLIPDPYRVSQQFSASNYSFKTEPVPFLTDFSAFQR